jgi:branched-chain amino acid aminotransferase
MSLLARTCKTELWHESYTHMPPASPPASLIYDTGILRSADSPVIAANDQAIVQGLALFETLLAIQGRPFAVSEHLERLSLGARRFGLMPPPEDLIREAISSVIQANQLGDYPRTRLRVTLTAGQGDRRLSPDPAAQRLLIEASPAPEYPEIARLITVPYCRNDRGALVGMKTINYGENALATVAAREAGADEALFPNTRNELCEATWANVFIYHMGKLITPPLESGCLPGVTRDIVIRLAGELGIPLVEANTSMHHLADIEGAFLTSTLRGLQGVGSIDGRILPEVPCPHLAELQAAYEASLMMEF